MAKTQDMSLPLDCTFYVLYDLKQVPYPPAPLVMMSQCCIVNISL